MLNVFYNKHFYIHTPLKSLSILALNLEENVCIIDFEFTNFMGGICVALVLSDGSAVYLVGESTEADNVKILI
jgi:hypothetical protein